MDPKLLNTDLKFIQAIDAACEMETLADALAWICVWESERVIPIAHSFLSSEDNRSMHNPGWETCFKFLIDETMKQFTIKRLKGK